ncbi:MAG: arsenite efflux transporter metallochaperone ArsD [Desulfuromonadales bacterium]
MKIEIYDPPMCCPSGVCGPSVDPKLVKLQEILRKIEQAGVGVERHNLASAPQAFVENAEVGALLRSEGNGVLPLTFLGGILLQKGRYPEPAEFEQALLRQGIKVDLGPDAKPTRACG